MNLLDLAHDIGLNPFKVSITQGGEYKSPCPRCGGKDRFFIQPYKLMKHCSGYYRCRQCEIHGDTIQFAMEFKHMDFKAATSLIGIEPVYKSSLFIKPTKQFHPPAIQSPALVWQSKATSFALWAHQNIWQQQSILEQLQERGIPHQAIKTYKIGWNPQDIFRKKHHWGIEQEQGTIWLPSGIVIPTMQSDGTVLRLKIRRSSWQPTDSIGKYIAVSGSINGLNLIGDTQKELMVIVESELDAYAVHHAVQDLAFIVAVGSNIKNPDNVIDYFAKTKTLLICYDNDKGGIAMWNKWHSFYPHAKAYPTPRGKDIGEAITQGLNIRSWIIKHGWINSPDQALIDWALHYMSQDRITRESYKIFEREIALGPTSARAKTRELQDGLLYMKQLVEEYYAFKSP